MKFCPMRLRSIAIATVALVGMQYGTAFATAMDTAASGAASATPGTVAGYNWREENAYTLGVQAYVVGFPWIHLSKIRWRIQNVKPTGNVDGMIAYLTLWFPSQYRTRMMGWFLAAIPLSSVFSGPLSVAMLKLDGSFGLHGWQWLFILQGLPACVLGALCLIVLTDTPDKAKWLTPDERAALQSAISNEQQGRPGEHSFSRSLREARVWLLAAILFSYIIGTDVCSRR